MSLIVRHNVKADTLFSNSAGILGLASAIEIQKSLGRKSSVLIVAREWPSDQSIHYTSPWAGAHGRSIPAVTPSEIQHEKFSRVTYAVLASQAAEEPASGVEFMDGYDFLATPSDAYIKQKGGYGKAAGFKVLDDEDLPKDMGITYGTKYKTWCLNSPVYCAYLLRKFILRGGKTMKRSLDSAEEGFSLAHNVDVVVNCSGFGFGDPKVFPIRGEIALPKLLV